MSDCIAFILYRRLDLELKRKLLPTYLEPRYIKKNDDDNNKDNDGIGCL